jgi:mannose/fructose/N-acetylgalactosamine-specific phosphotransferase system component IIC
VLSTAIFIVCVAIILVAQMFILRSALASPVVSQVDRRVPQPRRGAEVAWALLPAIGLALVLWLTWRETRAAIPPPPPMPAHEHHGASTS